MSNFEERLLRRNTPGRWSELDAPAAGPGLPMTKNSNAISSDANIEEDEYDYVRRKEEGSDSLAFDFDGSGDLVDIPETLQRQITGVGNRARPQLGPKVCLVTSSFVTIAASAVLAITDAVYFKSFIS